MLAVRDAARQVEIEPTEAGAVGAQLNLVERRRWRIQIGEETDAARPVRARRKVVDRVALNLRPILQRTGVPRPVLGDRRQGKRLAVRRLDRQRVAGQLEGRHLLAKRDTDVEEHPLLTDRPVGGLVSEDHVTLVVVRSSNELPLHGVDLRHAGLGQGDGLLGLTRRSNGGPDENQDGENERWTDPVFHETSCDERLACVEQMASERIRRRTLIVMSKYRGPLENPAGTILGPVRSKECASDVTAPERGHSADRHGPLSYRLSAQRPLSRPREGW